MGTRLGVFILQRIGLMGETGWYCADCNRRRGVFYGGKGDGVMDRTILFYAGLLLLGVFLSAISQVMLKKAALRQYSSKLREYLNPLVIVAYTIFVGTTFLSIYAYKGIPLSMGPVLEATSYIYVTIFGVTIFKEKLNKRKLVGLVLIMAGIIIYSSLG